VTRVCAQRAAAAALEMVPYSATIVAMHDECVDTRTFVLRLAAPVAALDAALPGQFVMLSLLGYGEAPFTLAALPRDGAAPATVTVTVRRVGALTWALFACEVGDRVGVRGPFGRGFPVERVDHPTLYVAGGCGLAPLRSAIEHQLRRRPSGTRLAVAYGARTPETRILRASLARWRSEPDVVVAEVVERASRDGERVGRVVDVLDECVAAIAPRRAFLCGPPAMLRAASARLVAAGLAPDAVFIALERYMKCGTGRCGHCYVNDRYVCTDGPVFALAELECLSDAFAGLGPAHC
jgi:NAD(P)H-flavin reductase